MWYLIFLLIRFGWKTIWKTFMAELAPQSKDGSYVRPSYDFKGWISYDSKEFPGEEGRYHLYLGQPCPWCHRVSLAVALRGLGPWVSSSYLVDDPERASRGGWAFDRAGPRRDPAFGRADLRELYDLLEPGYTGRCTAPLLVDKKSRKIVSNESGDILKMLNEIRVAGRPHGLPDVDLRPPSLAAEIDALGDRLYTQLNNGVYRAGFATTQGAYDAAVQGVFSALDELEARLRGGGGGGKGGEGEGGGRGGPFLLGPRLTEADVRLFPTAVRFDAAYNTLFKCSKKRLADYPYLMEWMRLMHSLPGVSDTIDIEDCRRSYFEQLFPLNPGGIVPIGASKQDLGLVDFDERTNSIDFGAIFYAHSNNQI
uniref:GST C-terminal domain-containing protein n=1 Tax=Heterosigma akashiwo TaxID=2829 RepID=A0A6V1QE16_HETAK